MEQSKPIARLRPQVMTITDSAAAESNEVALTRFSTGAEFKFTATPVTLTTRTN